MGTPIHRYYLVAGEAEEIFPSVRDVVTAAGFEIDSERADECAPLGTGGPKMLPSGQAGGRLPVDRRLPSRRRRLGHVASVSP